MKKPLKTMEDYHWSKSGKFIRVRWFKKDYHTPAKTPLICIEVLDTGTDKGIFEYYTGVGLGTTYLWGLIGFWVIL